MQTLACAALLGLQSLSGCVNAEAVGAQCELESDCADLSGGFCTGSQICESPCSTHRDCGCNVDGVTMEKIANGACDTACVWGDLGQDFCARVCSSDDDCNGESRCVPNSKVGFSICR